MKTPVKQFISRFGFVFLVLFAALFWIAGCVTPKPAPDPLAGWHFSSLNNLHSNKAITDDYQGYIQTLSLDERNRIGIIELFEDGTRQHAVKIEIGIKGTWWQHVLIYDQNDKRIKAIKYSSGGYSS